MATGIVILVFGIYWLLRETDYLTIRLLVGKVKPEIDNQDSHNLNLKQTVNTTSEYTPTEFTPLDMPECIGTLNIRQFKITDIEYERIAQ